MTYEDEAQTEDSPSILTSLKCRDKTNKSGKVVSKKASVILFSFLLVSTLATFLAGSLFNIVEFTTYAGDDTVGCTIGKYNHCRTSFSLFLKIKILTLINCLSLCLSI